MNNDGLKSFLLVGNRNENTRFIDQIKTEFPAEVSFLQGKPYRPIRISLDQLQLIAKALKKGGSRG